MTIREVLKDRNKDDRHGKTSHLTDEEKARGVITASAGNHAQGVALAAQRRGVEAVIVMPVTTPSIKVDAVRALGGKTRVGLDDFLRVGVLERDAVAEKAHFVEHLAHGRVVERLRI